MICAPRPWGLAGPVPYRPLWAMSKQETRRRKDVSEDPWRSQMAALGAFIRTQRAMGSLTLRELAARTDVSNAYLSQIERGLHEPSIRVLHSIAAALGVPLDLLLAHAGLLEGS